MHQLKQAKHMTDRRCLLVRRVFFQTHERQAGFLAARINAQQCRLQGAVTQAAITQADHERGQVHHHRPTTFQQQSGALFTTRHQRLLVLSQYKHRHAISFFNRTLTGLVTQVFQPVSPRECLQPAPTLR
ncbi:hypothetical protein VRRI112168_18345 [Vreelandella rituensis]